MQHPFPLSELTWQAHAAATPAAVRECWEAKVSPSSTTLVSPGPVAARHRLRMSCR